MDAMIGRAIKRIMQLKAMKPMVGLGSAAWLQDLRQRGRRAWRNRHVHEFCYPALMQLQRSRELWSDCDSSLGGFGLSTSWQWVIFDCGGQRGGNRRL
jgi:hypothetical protein